MRVSREWSLGVRQSTSCIFPPRTLVGLRRSSKGFPIIRDRYSDMVGSNRTEECMMQEEDMINEARQVAEDVRQEYDLDFSLESLEKIDELLGGLRGCEEETVRQAAYRFGCYVGEMLVKRVGVQWAVQEGTENLFGSPLLLQAGRIQMSPIARCFKTATSDNDGVDVWARFWDLVL